jgi:putative hydrolase of HD superfamily
MPQFLYRIQPARLGMLTDGPTEDETRIVGEHFTYLKGLADAGVVLMAGRTLHADERTFGIVVFTAESEAAAEDVMLRDPAVRQGVMRAELHPYSLALWSRTGPDRPPANASSDDLERIFAFMLELDRLKAVFRRSRPAGLERRENSAEHSWQVGLLALLLAGHAREPLDAAHAAEMLLVHDIPEIDVGDQIVYERPSDVRAAAERDAARRIFGLLPEAQAARCLALWEEFEARKSREAVFARALDRLMPVLQNLQSDGRTWRENGIRKEQVLTVNSVIGEALPEVWDRVRPRIEALFDETGGPA